MDRSSSRPGSPVYTRQKSISSSSGGPGSPMMSPMHRHVRSGSVGVANFRRPQNIAARAAAQRLARVMADKPADDNSDEDELDGPPVGLSTPRRAARSPSPAAPSALGRYPSDQSFAVRPSSAGRPSAVAKPTALIPPIKPSSRPLVTSMSADPASMSRREQRMSVDLGNLSMRVSGHPRSSTSLPDEIDAQQEENENIIEKLRLAEEKCEEAEARVRQHEKQVASFGEGVSLEARHPSRKEATFKPKEVSTFNDGASLEAIPFTRKVAAPQRIQSVRKVASQNSDTKSEVIAALRFESKMVKNDAASVTDHLQEVESEIKSL